MTYLLIALLLVNILLYWDYLLFILAALPIRHFAKRQRLSRQTSEKPGLQSGRPSTAKHWLRRRLWRCFTQYIRYIDLRLGMFPSITLRRLIYRHIFRSHLGINAILHYGTEIRSHWNLSVGNRSIIGDRALLDARNGIYIGEDVNISSDVQIYTEQHDYRDPEFLCQSDATFAVRIDSRVWIGPRVTILHSVHIGEGAVIAAGAVVTKDVPPFSVMAGIPAKCIGERPRHLSYEFTDNDYWFY
ncbi:MAG: acyltransferase [Prevotella sp.]|nr:acyltransferase [Prevotella sp.]